MAFRTQKISQMTPKGSDLEATDLIEVSTIESGSYVTRSITGQELIDAIPLPPSGITIGTTAITSGTVGRVLFEGTGNVVQESANLFWDNTNGRLGIGGSPAVYNLDVKGIGIYRGGLLDLQNTTGNFTLSFYPSAGNIGIINSDILRLGRISNSTVFLQGFASGNVGINTTTDAGFRLDVNGTARVQGALTTSAGIISNGTVRVTATTASPSGNASFFVFDGAEGTNFAYDYGTATYRALAYNGSLVRFLTAGTERARFAITTGNFLINTTTDAGFKLDVNGTARVSNGITTTGADSTINATTGVVQLQKNGSNYIYINNDSFALRLQGSQVSMVPTLGVAIGALFDLGGNYAGYRGVNIRGAWTLNLSDTPDTSARLQVDSTNRGFLPPRMTTTQKNAIASPATGLQIFDTTLNRPCFYDGTTWITL